MASVTSIELKRHYRGLSAKETDDLIGDLAHLIVDFLKARSDHVAPMHGTQSATVAAGRECGRRHGTSDGRD